jgi:E3 ubiquitin-protein ligase BOI-like protein
LFGFEFFGFLQNEQLKSFIEEKRQRHTRQLIAAAEEGFARKLREKDAEMEKVKRQNQELMDRFTQLNAESQHWQSKMRSTEAMVNVLRSNLAHAQQQSAQFPPPAPPAPSLLPKEGCGDSDAADDCASSYVDDINDAHTRACLENKELREQRTCRVCRCNDVSMLLLPCRHLCLCHDCEGQLLACPLCRTPKNASVQVYMS